MEDQDRDKLLLTMAGQISAIEERTRDLPARVRSLEDARLRVATVVGALGALGGYLAKYVLPCVLAFHYANGSVTPEYIAYATTFGPYVMGPLS